MIRTDSLLMDTHVWYRSQGNPGALRSGVAAVIEDAASRRALYVSVISVWELAMLERGGRLDFESGITKWVEEALARPGIHLLDYRPEIAIASVNLPDPMHKDPSDRILVASALIEKLTLVTSDKPILAFSKSIGLPHLRA